MNKTGLSIIICCLFCYVSVFAQTTSKPTSLSISGRVVDIKTNKHIPFVSIAVKRTGLGTISDTLGVFHLRVQQDDTLTFSALGYHAKTWALPCVFGTENPPFFHIELKEKSYKLKEVNVYAFGTYEQFRNSFIHLKLEEKNPINSSIYQALKPYMRRVGEKNPVPLYLRPKMDNLNVLNAIFRPASFVYCALSKKERAKRKMSRYIKDAPRRKIIAEKYNAKVVADITGLKGEELIRFMEFFGAKTKRITPQTPDYEVTKEIMEAYQLYLSKKTEKRSSKG